MIIVETDSVSQLLNILENIVKSGHSPYKNEIDALLSTKSISFIIEVYSRWPNFSREAFGNISQIDDKYGLPKFSNQMIKQVSAILGNT